jgi:ferredoxin
MWVLHMLLSLTFVALIPYTKMMHLFLAPITVILTEPLTEMEVNPPFHLGLQSVDEIAAANHGLQGKTPRDFTFLQLLSLDACTECGRCDEVCPAALSGMPLAPRNIVIKLRGQMHKPDQPLTGFAEEELLSCTTCGACSERCPVSIRHVPLILTLRQGMIAENNLEPELARTLANLQAYRNPWGYPAKARSNWAKGLKIAEAERKGAG